MSDLRKSALNSNEDISDFYNLQIKSSTERQKAFDKLCGYLSLDTSNPDDLKQANKGLLKRNGKARGTWYSKP